MTEVSTPAPRPAYENPQYNHTGYDMDQTDVALPMVEPASASFTLHDAGEKVSTYAEEAVDRAGDYAQAAVATTTKFAGEVADRIRNNAELPNERGTTTIADEVVEK